MELTHSFTVPTSRERAWEAFGDVASVAECFPGASVDSVSGDDFTGSCKVKLGPIALVYTGSGRFLERDEAAGRMVLDARGKDKRGNGTAGAKVTVSLTEADASSTDVQVLTHLQITGKPAQFGRGVIQDVSDRLLQQFVTCLEQKVGAPQAGTAEPAAPAAQPAPSAGQPAPAAQPAPSAAHQPAAAAHQPAAAAQPAAVAGAERSPVSTAERAPESESATPPHGDPLAAATGIAAGARSTASGGTGGTGAATATGLPRREPPQDDALDLGATVLPVLVRSYGKQAAAGLGALAVLALLWRLLRRQ